MKALFIKCNGELTPDMLAGALVNMGVPEIYLQAEGKKAGLYTRPIIRNNPYAQIGATYFYQPPVMGEENLTMEGLKAEWMDLCEKGCQDFLMPGNKVMEALQAGLNETGDSLQDLHVVPENLISLYYILLGISYLEADAIFTCPLDITAGKTEQGRAVSAILKRKGATAGLPIPVEGISTFAAAILEGLSEEFQSMDGRFIVDATSYGTSQIENLAGENTVTLYLGYYTEKNNSIFNRRLQIFGR